MEIEKRLGGNLPDGFPTIDKMSDGTATSIKSVDLGAKSYGNPDTITRVGKGYIDDVAGFEGARRKGVTVKPSDIKGRALEIAVPHGATPEQCEALNGLIEYGRKRGVAVTIVELE